MANPMEAGVIMAAPAPWRPRRAISTGRDGARAAPAAPAARATIPMLSIFSRPNRSAQRPATINMAA